MSTPSTATTDEKLVQKGSGSRTGLYAVIGVVVIVIILVGAAYAAGWLKPASTSPGTTNTSCTVPGSQPLSGAGSTLVAPLMFTWAQTYTQSTVSYQSVGSGAGINDITAKTVDYGASDAPLSPTQRAAITSPGVVTIPESAGAVVPIYNLPSVAVHLHFTGAFLAAVYLGDITNWNSTQLQTLNPGVVLPTASIVVVHRSDGSGTSFIWTSYLSTENATWNSTIGFATSVNWPVGVGSKGNSGVTSTVQSTVDAIGYVDINYALTNSVAFGAVQNPTGNFILANISNIASAIKDANPTLPTGTGDWYSVSVQNAPGAGDYPISSFTYVFVYTDLGAAYGSAYSLDKAENLVNFLSWIIHTGQNYSGELYYIPLAPSVVAADQVTIAAITYNGAAIPECVG